MNPDFTRYQQLPSLDALIVSANLAEIGVRTESRPNVKAHRSLFPLPEGEGQGEGKSVVKPALTRQERSFRA